MLYDYICPKCGSRKEIDAPYGERKVESPECESCGAEMRRNWGSFLYTQDSDRSDNISETSWLKQGMKKRFSGKTRIYY